MFAQPVNLDCYALDIAVKCFGKLLGLKVYCKKIEVHNTKFSYS